MAAAIGEAWKTLEAAITAYTGLSPAAFFTALAVSVALYYAVVGCFAAPPPPRRREADFPEGEPLAPPVQLGEITEEELRQYDGSDPKKPLLMAIKGQIYDVSQSSIFYGPGGPYALFAGKDASRALAKMSFEEKDLTGDLTGLGPFELDALQDWEYRFMGKYIKVGTIKKPEVTAEGDSSNNASGINAAEPREADEHVNAISAGPVEADEHVNAISAGPGETDEHKNPDAAEPREVQEGATKEPVDATNSNDQILEQKVPDCPENKD